MKLFHTTLKSILTVILFFPWVVVLLVGSIIIPSQDMYINEVLAFLLMSIAGVTIISIIKNTRVFKLAALFGYLFLAFFAFLKLSFYYQYGVPISASALFVIFETNSTEASDYLSHYFSSTTILLAGILLVAFFIMLWQSFKRNRNVPNTTKTPFFKKLWTCAVLLFISVICLYGIKKYVATHNIPYAALATWDEYKTAKQNLKNNLAQPTSDAFSNVSSQKKEQTYIVVLGESTSSWHMQLYGYPRETNPELTKIEKDLVVMDSVISPHVHTILALEKILTLTDSETPKPSPNGSIIQLANQAGFTTYWVSNQKPVGLYESIPTILGSAATHRHFLATDDYNFNIYDEHLIPTVQKILKEHKTEKKIIFVHLIGTHLRYEKRYPKNSEHFTAPYEHLKYTSEKAIIQTNAYDNATRYNDMVIRKLIQLLEQEDTTAWLTYLSDHGDEVYDTMDFLGHNEYHGTRPMFEVPFLFWFSEKYKREMPVNFKKFEHRKYSLEHFPHTFAGLSGIQFNGYDASKNVLDSTFVARKRIVKDTVDYDQR
ncbi:sulfatase-like hydrolase/transferase [Marinirhabdus gelatinilytica]|uniref:Heptose-I-phosphate ethanolaminephosphotransferase n=1 Tax=Marinirhabdus gelatinilytica TaxID=1703343 RepID=A0A370QFK1_9FLAO|nr:sulfatase-like hydrolase/transferase [Marinirhabdus gelatinilytica]RDK87146.1 heptose-I-phosphate ethanolaminephosphotransferase [Marinirhabdus gelatinilytica]